MRPILLLASCLLALPGVAFLTPAFAQINQSDVVRESGDPAERLGRYLRQLADNPRDLTLLTGSGRAALELGDASGALGFFARAEQVAPRDGRVKAGLASALVAMEQPKEALKLFGDAVELGVPEAEIASDRGLARDLRGDNRHAQADYMLALRSRPDPETTRRLALSQAISGDRATALATLQPLLQRGDKGADRARAFVLALTGDPAGAEKAARDEMSAQQVVALTPFLVRLPTLKAGQKAAAVHFGHFPSTGRRYSEAELFADASRDATVAGRQPATGKALIPRGTGLGLDDVSGDEEPVFAAAPPKPSRAPRMMTPARAEPSGGAGRAALVIRDEAEAKAKPETKAEARAKADAEAKEKASEAKDKAKSATAAKAKTKAEAAAKAKTEAAAKEKAEAAKAKVEAAAKAKADAKAKAAAPERYWVQVASGKNKGDLGKAWNALVAKQPKLLRGRDTWTTPWRASNRLLIGPFKSDDAAQALVNDLAKAGLSTIQLTTRAGVPVERLSTK
jgi:Flp pilus assembly protein TadD